MLVGLVGAVGPAGGAGGHSGPLLLLTCDQTVDSANGVPYFRAMLPNGRGFRTIHQFRDLGGPDYCYIREPSWSPDGRRIVYSDYSSVWTMRADGKRFRRVVKGNYPDWSPNGREIAFVRGGALYRARADGTRIRQITPSFGEIFDVSWSPDGRTIAFARWVPAHDSIWVVRASGGNPRKRVDEARFPSWSPDSRTLLFVDEHQRSVWKIRSGHRRRITPVGDEYSIAAPVFSPDGRRVVFVRWGRAWIMGPDGRRAHPFSPVDARVGYVDWRPGG